MLGRPIWDLELVPRSKVRGVLLDLDGVLYVEDDPIEGALRVVERFRDT
jgi:ribonucleotide monophosphatase NagD (HAD superfamily)